MNIIELKEHLTRKNISFSEEQITKLVEYMNYILKTNESINLTAITDVDSFIDKMIYDSALPLTMLDFTDKKVVDVGTGAGFPGTVIKTLTNCDMTLLDSTRKKLDVIGDFYKDINLVNDRVENFALSNRESYDIAIARAVAPLNVLLELIIPIIKVNGYFIAMKSLNYENEINDSLDALKKLNCHIVEIKEETLQCGEDRFNILIQKDAPTNKKYPRNFADIKNKPL